MKKLITLTSLILVAQIWAGQVNALTIKTKNIKLLKQPKTHQNMPTTAPRIDVMVAQAREIQGQLFIERAIREKFGEFANTAVAIAKAESGMRSNAIGDHAIAFYQDGIEYGKSYGVFQIRHLPGRPSPADLLNAEFNIDYAYKLFMRSGFTPWSAYTNGSYYKFIQQ